MMAGMAESDPSPNPPRGRSNTRLVMISAALGALLILLVSVLLNWWSGGQEAGTPGGIGEAPAPQAVFEAQAGTCLNWAEPDGSDIRQVTCDEPHLFQVTGQSELGPEFGPQAPFPGPEQWQQLKQDRCQQVSEEFLNDSYDPTGRFQVGAFTPSREAWDEGDPPDRTLHCGLQQPGPSGKLYRMRGEVAEADQSDTYEQGRCLGINGTEVWDPVGDCRERHAVEITGLVDLGEQFPEGFPPEDEQDGFLSDRCRQLTAEYAGSPTAARDKGLVTYWDTVQEESWNVGSQRVNCKVSAQLPDGSGLAPVAGSVRGDVRVGDQPAPRDPAGEQPGVPAGNSR